MIVARLKQHVFSTVHTEEISAIEDRHGQIKEGFKQQGITQSEEWRNGHLINKTTLHPTGRIEMSYEKGYMNQYELFFKPMAKNQEWMDKFNSWLVEQDPMGQYIWNGEYKRNDGQLPHKFNCWCAAIEEFLIENKFEWRGWESDGSGNGGTQVSIRK